MAVCLYYWTKATVARERSRLLAHAAGEQLRVVRSETSSEWSIRHRHMTNPPPATPDRQCRRAMSRSVRVARAALTVDRFQHDVNADPYHQLLLRAVLDRDR